MGRWLQPQIPSTLDGVLPLDDSLRVEVFRRLLLTSNSLPGGLAHPFDAYDFLAHD